LRCYHFNLHRLAQGGWFVKIEEMLFMGGFGTDRDYSSDADVGYLDKQTGDLLWQPKSERCSDLEEMHAEHKELLEADPDRYLPLPELDHVDFHHAVLKAFLKEDPDEAGLYGISHSSIGKWKESVDEAVWYSFVEFRDERKKEEAEKFLAEHGIEAEWI
jgi:hypothetical protein